MRELTDKELGTIIFSLEQYAQVLESESDISTRNYVYELIWKVCDIKTLVNN